MAKQAPKAARRKPSAKKPTPQPKVGPRPLWLHLQTAILTYQSLRLALPAWQAGQIPFHPNLAERANALRENLNALSLENQNAVQNALGQIVAEKQNNLWDGVRFYQTHHIGRPKLQAKIIWRKDKIRLLDYGAKSKDAPVVFIIPSLVNRYYILDLLPDRSFAQYLKSQGFRVLILDWDAPGKVEKKFTLDHYSKIMLAAFDAACKKYPKQKPTVAGYCMGGVFALAAAIHRPKKCGKLILIATPWDFSHHEVVPEKTDFYLQKILPEFQKNGLVPVDWIQSMFYDLDPHLVIRKFEKIGKKPPVGSEAVYFTALEDWINDGVELTTGVLRQCLRDWYNANLLGKNRFPILGKDLNPIRIAQESLLVIPESDRIVPPQSALALGIHLTESQVMMAQTGHIGLMVSNYAKREIWPKIANWLQKR